MPERRLQRTREAYASPPDRAEILNRVEVIERLLLNRRIDEATGCWTWAGFKRHDGYGVMQARRVSENGHTVADRVHRLAYEAFVGPIPFGLTVDHLCFNRACFNPTHLEAVTNVVNVRRGSVNIKRTLTEEDTTRIKVLYGDGGVLTMRQLAAQWNVSFSVIQRAIRG